MNHTMFNSTVAAASHRLEEKQYGEEIFRNLHTLALFHKPSTDLVSMLSKEMFVKPNTKAFSHVMHYLFTILVEPREFRKFFFWPIIDKAGETNFRTASMVQMNNLIQKYQLALEPVKMHVVVLPGGLKFMKGLLEFTVIAMRETLAKQMKSEDSMIKYPLNDNCELESKRTEEIIGFSKSLELNLANIQKCLKKVQSTISILSVDTQLSVTKEFLQLWQQQLDNQTTNQIEPGFQKINSFAEQCVAINDLVQKIVTNRHKQIVAVDKDALKRCQAQFCIWMSSQEMQTTIRRIFETNEYNYGNVVNIFEAFLPTILQHIRSFDYRRLDNDVISFESNIIEQMCCEAAALKVDSDAQLKRLETYFDWAQNKYPRIDDKENESPEEHNYNRRFLSTPPIRLRSANTNSIMSTHLPWQFEETAISTQLLPPSSTKKGNQSLLGTPNRNHNTSLNSSIQARSNAMSMLNMVRDRCTNRMDQRNRLEPPTNTNLPASLQKTMRNHIHFASPSATTSKTSSSTSTFYTGIGSSRVFTEKLFETSATLSPDTIILRQRCETNSVIHLTSPAERPNFLRTSPSGRFIIPDSNPSQSLSAIEEPIATTDNNTTICHTPSLSSSDRTVMALGSNSTENGSLDGSGANATARKIVFSPEATLRMKIDDAEEALFNVSDTVLQDITL